MILFYYVSFFINFTLFKFAFEFGIFVLLFFFATYNDAYEPTVRNKKKFEIFENFTESLMTLASNFEYPFNIYINIFPFVLVVLSPALPRSKHQRMQVIIWV